MATLDTDSKEHYKKPFNFEEAEKQGFTRKTLFETEHMRFSVYMILPGQETRYTAIPARTKSSPSLTARGSVSWEKRLSLWSRAASCSYQETFPTQSETHTNRTSWHARWLSRRCPANM